LFRGTQPQISNKQEKNNKLFILKDKDKVQKRPSEDNEGVQQVKEHDFLL
jgi:hypothetical protein